MKYLCFFINCEKVRKSLSSPDVSREGEKRHLHTIEYHPTSAQINHSKKLFVDNQIRKSEESLVKVKVERKRDRKKLETEEGVKRAKMKL